jgi:hypothetical protein
MKIGGLRSQKKLHMKIKGLFMKKHIQPKLGKTQEHMKFF